MAEAERCFSEEAVLLNRRILLLNQSAPGLRWARPLLDIECEISRLGAPAVTVDGPPPALHVVGNARLRSLRRTGHRLIMRRKGRASGGRWREPAPSDRLPR